MVIENGKMQGRSVPNSGIGETRQPLSWQRQLLERQASALHLSMLEVA
jgi:hypothetical protein